MFPRMDFGGLRFKFHAYHSDTEDAQAEIALCFEAYNNMMLEAITRTKRSTHLLQLWGGRTHCMVLFQTLRTAQTLSQHQAHPLIFSAGLHSLTACRWSNLPISSTTYLFFVPRLILMALGWRSSYPRFGTPP
jgi:hypothetical protein|nr:hypothetical protein Q903MT_gene1124 [Picea sitchensis]